MKRKKLTFLAFSRQDFGTGPHVLYIILLKLAYLCQEPCKIFIQVLFLEYISKPHAK